MDYLTQFQAAAEEAQGVLAELTGGTAIRIPFLRPAAFEMTILFPDASQQEALGRELTMHGQRSKTILIGHATRSQFTASPMQARGKPATREGTPNQAMTIRHIDDSDPTFYVFVFVVDAAT